MEFYNEEVDSYVQEFATEKEMALKSPLGIAFVTLKTYTMSKEVYDSFKKSFFDFGHQVPESSLSPILKPNKWKVKFAPEPEDIYWENLSISGNFLKVKS